MSLACNVAKKKNHDDDVEDDGIGDGCVYVGGDVDTETPRRRFVSEHEDDVWGLGLGVGEGEVHLELGATPGSWEREAEAAMQLGETGLSRSPLAPRAARSRSPLLQSKILADLDARVNIAAAASAAAAGDSEEDDDEIRAARTVEAEMAGTNPHSHSCVSLNSSLVFFTSHHKRTTVNTACIPRLEP